MDEELLSRQAPQSLEAEQALTRSALKIMRKTWATASTSCGTDDKLRAISSSLEYCQGAKEEDPKVQPNEFGFLHAECRSACGDTEAWWRQASLGHTYGRRPYSPAGSGIVHRAVHRTLL